MASDYNYLPVSNGSGDVPLMTVQADRAIGNTVISVDTVTNVPTDFIATTGTLLSTGFIDPTTKCDFKGHVSGTDLIIDAFEPGSTDAGNTAGQKVMIKPNTGWANRIAQFIKNATGFGTPEALECSSLTVNGQDLTSLIPTGSVLQFAGSAAPTGFLLCQGQAVSRTTYAALFAAIASTYGNGDGSTTFNLPDFQGKVATGYKSGDSNFGTIGGTGGEVTHTLTQAEMPAHTHTVPSTVSTAGGSGALVNTIGAGTQSSGSTGGGGAHNNLQPFLTVNYIIKT